MILLLWYLLKVFLAWIFWLYHQLQNPSLSLLTGIQQGMGLEKPTSSSVWMRDRRVTFWGNLLPLHISIRACCWHREYLKNVLYLIPSSCRCECSCFLKLDNLWEKDVDQHKSFLFQVPWLPWISNLWQSPYLTSLIFLCLKRDVLPLEQQHRLVFLSWC